MKDERYGVTRLLLVISYPSSFIPHPLSLVAWQECRLNLQPDFTVPG